MIVVFAKLVTIHKQSACCWRLFVRRRRKGPLPIRQELLLRRPRRLHLPFNREGNAYPHLSLRGEEDPDPLADLLFVISLPDAPQDVVLPHRHDLVKMPIGSSYQRRIPRPILTYCVDVGREFISFVE